MKKLNMCWFGLLVVMLVALAASTPAKAAPVASDECFWLQLDLSYATDQMQSWSYDVAFDELQVSWDISEGRGPGDPVFDHDVHECVVDGGFYDYWQGQIGAINDTMHEAHCF